MEDSAFIEKLDSLRFFSNVLSSRSQVIISDTDEKATQDSVNHSSEVEAAKPLTPENKENQIEGSRPTLKVL